MTVSPISQIIEKLEPGDKPILPLSQSPTFADRAALLFASAALAGEEASAGVLKNQSPSRELNHIEPLSPSAASAISIDESEMHAAAAAAAGPANAKAGPSYDGELPPLQQPSPLHIGKSQTAPIICHPVEFDETAAYPQYEQTKRVPAERIILVCQRCSRSFKGNVNNYYRHHFCQP